MSRPNKEQIISELMNGKRIIELLEYDYSSNELHDILRDEIKDNRKTITALEQKVEQLRRVVQEVANSDCGDGDYLEDMARQALSDTEGE